MTEILVTKATKLVPGMRVKIVFFDTYEEVYHATLNSIEGAVFFFGDFLWNGQEIPGVSRYSRSFITGPNCKMWILVPRCPKHKETL